MSLLTIPRQEILCPRCDTKHIVTTKTFLCSKCAFTANIISCKCDCGNTRLDRNKRGRLRQYINSHKPKREKHWSWHGITQNRKNIIIKCAYEGCNDTLLIYPIRADTGTIRWSEPRKFCPSHKGFWNLGRKLSKEHVQKIQLSKLGDKNPNWKGDDVEYDALHDYIKRRFPKSKLCQECGKIPPYDIAFLLHPAKYTRNINDYKWLCRSCHTILDFDNGVRKTRDMRGSKNPMFGKKRSEETKKKIGIKIKQYYSKNRHPLYGKNQSEVRKRPAPKDFGQVCKCGSTYVIRKGQNLKQQFQCRSCGKYWSVEVSLLKEFYK